MTDGPDETQLDAAPTKAELEHAERMLADENMRACYAERSMVLARSAALQAARLAYRPGWSTIDGLRLANTYMDYIVSGAIPPEPRRF